MHASYLRAGWPGLVAGGVGFIVPAMLIVLGLAWAYVRFGTLPAATWLLYGVKPVIIAIIVQALWGLGRKAVKGPLTAALGVAVIALYFLGVNELLLLGASGLLAWLNEARRGPAPPAAGRLRAVSVLGLPALAPLLAQAPVSLPVMFLIFLKIGSVLYGSGYVLLAFLRSDFVVRLGWLTDAQLLDAVAIGQVTPGPVFTTATFIGYLLGGVPGALLATLGIFLPAFVFVALSVPLLARLRGSRWATAVLDGLNAASVGLMAAVTLQLGRASLVDALTVALALAAAVALVRFKVNATWLVAAGAAVGLAASVFQ
jgi:chromate transporter